MKAQQKPNSKPESSIPQAETDTKHDRAVTRLKQQLSLREQLDTSLQNFLSEVIKIVFGSLTNAVKWVVPMGVTWLIMEAFKATSGYYQSPDATLKVIFSIAELLNIVGGLAGFVVWDFLGLKDLFKDDQDRDGRGQS